MLHSIVIMRKGRAGVVGRIDEDALHLARVLGLEGFQGKEVVAEDELVVEEVGIAYAMVGVVALRRVLDEYAGLEAGAGFLADPGQFEFGLQLGTF